MPLQLLDSMRFESYLDIVYQSEDFMLVQVGEAQDHSSCNHPRTYLLRLGLQLHHHLVKSRSASDQCLESYCF
jgi:hypothetical protein